MCCASRLFSSNALSRRNLLPFASTQAGTVCSPEHQSSCRLVKCFLCCGLASLRHMVVKMYRWHSRLCGAVQVRNIALTCTADLLKATQAHHEALATPGFASHLLQALRVGHQLSSAMAPAVASLP
jgi:hypothetical protein